MNKFFVLISVLFLIGCQAKIVPESEINPVRTESTETITEKKSAKKSTVEIIKFFDFLCPYCQQTNRTIARLQEKYGDQIQVSYRHFPSHSGSYELATAAECARDEGKFNEFKDRYFSTYFGKYNQETFQNIATDLALDAETFLTCLTADIKRPVIQQHLYDAKQFQVQGVPFFLVGKQKLVGAYPLSTFERVIDSQLTND